MSVLKVKVYDNGVENNSVSPFGVDNDTGFVSKFFVAEFNHNQDEVPVYVGGRDVASARANVVNGVVFYDENSFNSDGIELFFDGACKGNPCDHMTLGFVFKKGGREVAYGYGVSGRGTNNVAEYLALITALLLAKTMNYKSVIAHGDSQLVIKQVKGEYQTKNRFLSVLKKMVEELERDFDSIDYKWLSREKNHVADYLANIDMKQLL